MVGGAIEIFVGLLFIAGLTLLGIPIAFLGSLYESFKIAGGTRFDGLMGLLASVFVMWKAFKILQTVFGATGMLADASVIVTLGVIALAIAATLIIIMAIKVLVEKLQFGKKLKEMWSNFKINKSEGAVGEQGPIMFADGGISKGGLALVGEKGPELVNLPKNSMVHSNKDSKRMVGDSSVTNNITVNVKGSMGSSDAEIRVLADKIGKMIGKEINRTTNAARF